MAVGTYFVIEKGIPFQAVFTCKSGCALADLTGFSVSGGIYLTASDTSPLYAWTPTITDATGGEVSLNETTSSYALATGLLWEVVVSLGGHSEKIGYGTLDIVGKGDA